jgi:ketosteroid isomerase-like protein
MIASNLAPEWIASWNSHDLDRVLAFYTEDLELSLPHVTTIMGEPSGALYGQSAVRSYWEKAMALSPGLHFTLETVYTGPNSLIICYTNRQAAGAGRYCF